MRFSFKKSLSNIKNTQNTSQTYTEDLRKGIQENYARNKKKQSHASIFYSVPRNM